ncbi:hypothetical protein KSC_072980 [Ktedonobacter sp. SOSP1-52]|nr:hypothetical protein KSC_072980 [Ktedonobacter sp. SOSP1-52]
MAYYLAITPIIRSDDSMVESLQMDWQLSDPKEAICCWCARHEIGKGKKPPS